MASTKSGSRTVIYEVTHEQARGRWNIMRDGQPTGGFARDKSTAIGLAYSDASHEILGTNLKAEVWSVAGGKRKKEWP